MKKKHLQNKNVASGEEGEKKTNNKKPKTSYFLTEMNH